MPDTKDLIAVLGVDLHRRHRTPRSFDDQGVPGHQAAASALLVATATGPLLFDPLCSRRVSTRGGFTRQAEKQPLDKAANVIHS
jgi:hypothetical protein